MDHYWDSLGVGVSRHTFPSFHHFAWMAWNPSSYSPEKALKATLAYLFLPRGHQKMFFIETMHSDRAYCLPHQVLPVLFVILLKLNESGSLCIRYHLNLLALTYGLMPFD